MKAVFPEAVASAEQFMIAAPERIGKKDGFQRLQLGEGIENLRQGRFLHIELHLCRARKQTEIRIVMERNRVAVFFIGFQMMQQHSVPTVMNGFASVYRVMGVDAHSCQRMSVSGKARLKKGIIPAEKSVHLMNVIFRAKGKLQRVVAAIVRENIVILR